MGFCFGFHFNKLSLVGFAFYGPLSEDGVYRCSSGREAEQARGGTGPLAPRRRLCGHRAVLVGEPGQERRAEKRRLSEQISAPSGKPKYSSLALEDATESTWVT